MNTTLLLTLGGRGGTGKTLCLVAIADYLRCKGSKLVAIDCDTENAGKLSSFSHWFNRRAHALNLRNLSDCDKLLKSSATSGVPFVLADLPANSSADISDWWKDVATPDVLNELGLTIIGVGSVTASHGAAESVVEWISSLGESISYLVVLNRISFERVPRPKEEAFSDWFLVKTDGLELQTIEIGHLHSPTMDALASPSVEVTSCAAYISRPMPTPASIACSPASRLRCRLSCSFSNMGDPLPENL